MHIPRLYQNSSLTINETIQLNKEASHHLLGVLRFKVGDPVIIFNGQGGEYSGSIIAITKHHATIKLEKFNAINRESPLKIHLAQAIARAEKMDWILQKAVEMGVTEVTPVITEYTNVKLSLERWEKKLSHWQAVIINACEQSGRTTVPKLHAIKEFSQFITQPIPGLKLILHPYATTTISQLPSPTEVTLLIGSEGGLSEMEVQLAEQKHFTALQFGPRILRTETAGLAIMAALQANWGDAS